MSNVSYGVQKSQPTDRENICALICEWRTCERDLDLEEIKEPDILDSELIEDLSGFENLTGLASLWEGSR